MRYLQIFQTLLGLMLLASAACADDWKLVREDKDRDIRVYVRSMADTPYHGFYAITQSKVGTQTVVAVLSDVAAMPEWIARLKKTRVLKRKGDTDVWVHNTYKMPYPFRDREAILHSRLVHHPNGSVEIVSRAEKGAVPDSKSIRLFDVQSTWRITPTQNGGAKIEWWGQGDPDGYMLPALFNYSMPNEPARALKLLHQMLQRDKYQQETPAKQS